MSLFRQLWLTVVTLTLFAFLGSFLVSVLSARNYLEQQLLIKNVDNASSLALSLSQLPDKDPVTVELLVSAQFDTGHYQAIRLVDPHHQTIVERQDNQPVAGAPGWFVSLFPIRILPGIAQVQDGWRQYGTLSVQSHSQFAYRELWRSTLGMIAWFLAAAVVAGAIGTWLLRLIIRPLNQVVGQANALSERRFITVPEPKPVELKVVVRAMNGMVERLKRIFADEASRLEALRQQVNQDRLTGLPNREFFMARMKDYLEGEEAAPQGVLMMVRIAHLEKLNAALGRARADKLLRDTATLLSDTGHKHDGSLAARLNGSDFILLLPGNANPKDMAEALHAILETQLTQANQDVEEIYHLGVTLYRRGDNPGELLARADGELAIAQGVGCNAWHACSIEVHTDHSLPSETWRGLLTDAIDKRRIRLAQYPVISVMGNLLHQECMIRLQTEQDAPWLGAGDFMPMASRLNLTPTLDIEVIRLALAELETHPGEIAVNLSADTIADWSFHNHLLALLDRQNSLGQRLWVEVPEHGVFRQLEAFRDLARTLKARGCRIGIEHFGHRLGEIAKLADLGLDYLKIDGSFIRDIQHNSGNQDFVQGICKMAHTMGLMVIAESVRDDAEINTLKLLDIDGMTGPAVKLSN